MQDVEVTVEHVDRATRLVAVSVRVRPEPVPASPAVEPRYDGAGRQALYDASEAAWHRG